MIALLLDVLSCIRHAHDQRLIALSGLVCAVGIYASFALGMHAVRADTQTRRTWAAISIVAAGCTAWATHFIVLLAFRPGMPAAFDPLLTAVSLLCAVLGIGTGMILVFDGVRRWRRFGAAWRSDAGSRRSIISGSAPISSRERSAGMRRWSPRRSSSACP